MNDDKKPKGIKTKFSQKKIEIQNFLGKQKTDITHHYRTTIKILTIWTPETFAVIILKFEQGGFTIE